MVRYSFEDIKVNETEKAKWKTIVSMKSARSENGKVLHTEYYNDYDNMLIGSLQHIDDSWTTKMLIVNGSEIAVIQKGPITGR